MGARLRISEGQFQELVLSPRSDHGEGDPPETEEGDGLPLPHDRLAGAVVEIKATTTSSMNGNTF